MKDISNERKKKWQKTLEEIDMKQNSSNAWRLIRKLNCEKRTEHKYTNITANEIAHQIFVSGKLRGVMVNRITK